MCPEFPGISSCWTGTRDASIQLWGPCPFKTFKKHSLFFVTGAPASRPTHRSCCPVSLVSSTPRMHCVCTLVWMARAGCLAVLGSLSLPAPTPLLPPGAGVKGAQVLPRRLVSYPLHKVLGSRRYKCSLAVVLYLLVSLLGIVVFVEFSKIYMVLGLDFCCSTQAAILTLLVFMKLTLISSQYTNGSL